MLATNNIEPVLHDEKETVPYICLEIIYNMMVFSDGVILQSYILKGRNDSDMATLQ